MISISVAQLAVLAPNAQQDALLHAPLCHLVTFALVVEDGLPLDAAVSNALGDSVEAKETLLAVTRRECITSHIIRSRWLRVRKKRPLSDDQERLPGRPRLTARMLIHIGDKAPARC